MPFRPRTRRRRIGFAVAGICLLPVGLTLLVGFCLLPIWKTVNSARWNATTGAVIESRPIADLALEPRHGQSPFKPLVVTRYEVNGRAHEGYRIDFDGRVYSEYFPEVARNLTRRYPVGAKVTVYHDPDNPQESVLSRTFSGDVALTFLISLGVLYLAGKALAYAFIGETRFRDDWWGLASEQFTRTDYRALAAGVVASAGILLAAYLTG